MKRVLTVVLLANMIPAMAVAAESSKEMCAKLADPLAATATATGYFRENIEGASLSNVIYQLEGEERAALNKLQDTWRTLVPALKAYAAAMEDAAYTLRKCARD